MINHDVVDPKVSILLQLRDAAKVCPNFLTQWTLRQCADEIAVCVSDVAQMPCIVTFQALNSAVAKALKIVSNADLPTNNTPRGGALRDAAILAALNEAAPLSEALAILRTAA